MFLDVITAGPIETNAYLVGSSSSSEAAVIDVPLESYSLILEKARARGVTITHILLTHSHWDHIGDLASLKKNTNAPVYVHAEDAGNVRHPGSDRLPRLVAIEGVEPDYYLIDGQTIGVGGLTFEVIHTPGHSPGCVCFYEKAEGVLFSGDTLFQGGIGNLSLPTARPDKMRGSLQRLAELPGVTKVYPGHGGKTTIQEEAKRIRWIH